MRKIYFYTLENKLLFSLIKYKELKEISREESKEIASQDDIIYYLSELDPLKSRRSFSLSDSSLLSLKEEGINLLNRDKPYEEDLPSWIISKIESREVKFINTRYPEWQDVISYKQPDKWKVNILGLGDVGTTLLTGLRLVGGDCISKIGIYATSQNKVKRWELEMNQVLSPFNVVSYPEVAGISEDELFDCDMFVFCASKGVPPVESDVTDVRMVQFIENSKIVSKYAKMARLCNFKGIFAVVSDPVDLLCKVAFLESNKDNTNNFDYKGLAPEQVRGYGLGVMNARACYYAKENHETHHYLEKGRAFGPHGEGLIIANSIDDYDEELSIYLTEKAQTANLEVRKIGYKPYIAPALSSGALSILATIKGEWHYSATYMGGIYMGANNRNTKSGVELERLDLPDSLIKRLKTTFERLGKIL